MTSPKILILGYGNPGRGDDALGPELVSRIEHENIDGVECQTDMQLQVEHVTDLQGRERVIFVDADASCEPPFQFESIEAELDNSYTSHAMTPQALLHAYESVYGIESPPVCLMRIRGQQFELGETLSDAALSHLTLACEKLRSEIKSYSLASNISPS